MLKKKRKIKTIKLKLKKKNHKSKNDNAIMLPKLYYLLYSLDVASQYRIMWLVKRLKTQT